MRSVARQLKKKKQVPEIDLDHMFMGDRKERENVGFVGGPVLSQGSEEIGESGYVEG